MPYCVRDNTASSQCRTPLGSSWKELLPGNSPETSRTGRYSLQIGEVLVSLNSFSDTRHADHSEQFLVNFARWIGDKFLLQLYSSCWIQPEHAFLLYCICNDYTETSPGVILCPNKDARSRSARLQLGTAHIQSFTQTRQVSVVMGMTRFLAAIGS